MSTLRLRRAAFRIAARDEATGRGLAATIGGARPLLAGALEAALGGLPARSIVVVRRLELGLRVTGRVSPGDLATAWAEGVADALRAARVAAPAGAARDDAPVAVFASRAEAIRAHLLRRAAGLPDAWWAASALAGAPYGDEGAPHADRGVPPPAALLCELARTDPTLAASTLRALARQDARAFDLLDATTAATLARLLARGLPPEGVSRPPDAGAAATVPDVEAEAQVAGAFGSAAAARWRQLDPGCQRPWSIAARMLAGRAGTASPLSAAGPALAGEVPSPTAAADNTASPPASAASEAAIATDAAGALLLLVPAAALFPADALADRFRPAVLALLHRVLAPLPPAGRARAMAAERPLLDLLAPLPLPDAPVIDSPQDNEAADALAALIPDAVGRPPGAARRVFGTLPPTDTPAARLLLRPGRLLAEPGGAVVLWPHEAADIALRRLGWDRDPGFVPWLGRTLRFVFGAAP